MFDNFEYWMIGKRVIEKRTGDVGFISDSAYDMGDGVVWVNWETGGYAGSRLWISLTEISFVAEKESPHPRKEFILNRLTTIEVLLGEIREALKEGE